MPYGKSRMAFKRAPRSPGFAGAGAVDVWLCRRDEAGSADRFRRTVLSRYATVAPPSWRFGTSASGKPHLLDSPRPLAFNSSSSRDWLACAVTAGAAVGVDLEYCDPRRDTLKLGRRFFQPPELEALRACTQAAERTGLFYDYWTLKEAHIKARGGTLARHLEHTGFSLSVPPLGSGRCGTISPLMEPVGGHAFYYLLDPLPGYRLALCCQAQLRGRPCPRVLELLPGGLARSLPGRLRALGGSTCDSAIGPVAC